MIADVFIRRPVTAIVISIVIVMLGSLAIFNLPVSQYPDITPPTVQITGNFTGADAQTVEQTVTTPIEVQVNGTPGMTSLQSSSTSNGQSTMTVYFEIGTDIDISAIDVQNRVAIAEPLLPTEVKQLGLTIRKRNPSILMLVAIYSPKGTHSVKYLNNYANIYVRDALNRVKGVGDILSDIISRTNDFSMRIWLYPDKLAQLGLTPGDVTNALQEQNIQVAAGAVGSPPQNALQAFEYSVNVNGRLTSVDEFKNVVVKTRPENGSLVHLSDVARVELGNFNYSNSSFVDKHPSAYLLIYQTATSNALETAQGIYNTMAELKKTFPPDLDFIIPYEAVSVVKVSIHEIIITLLIALGLVTLVVFLFLQTGRSTLIPVLAIPVAIVGTFVFFIPLGFTINTLTMFGFVLAIGIVVDDAIIVVEAAQHNIDEENMSAKEAIKKAMKDISGPVIAIALILASVFIPVGFIPGIVGRLYQQFAITIAVSVLISAFIALSLSPALCYLFLKKTEKQNGSKNMFGRFFNSFNNWFNRLTEKYSNAVQISIKKSKLVISILLIIIFCTVILFKYKPSGFIPVEDEGLLYITFELPEASSTVRSTDVMKQMMDILQQTPGVGHFAALGGLNIVTFSTKPNNGTILCQLKAWEDRNKKSLQLKAIINDLQERFSKIPEAVIEIIPPPPIPGLGATAGFNFIIEQRSTNEDVKSLEKVLKDFLSEINKRPEISGAFSFYNASTPAYKLEVDREKCKKLGVSLADVFSAIQTFMGSNYINDFTIYGRLFHVVAQADTTFRSNINKMEQYYVRSQSGEMVPLSTLISYKTIETASLIPHFNLFRSAEVDGVASAGYSSGQAIEALQETADKVIPDGYGYEFSGLSSEELKARSATIYVFSLSIVFVFLFLAALYESWSVPFSVLLAVPISAFGALLTLTIYTSLTNNVYAQIGLLTLIGLSAKNAILIVEFAKQRVDNGMELIAATTEAVKLRLRPIIMTSLAFILGVIPLAFASGAGAVARSTIGWAVFGGMIAATSISIFVVPVLFVTITRLAYGKEKLEQLQNNAHKKDQQENKNDGTENKKNQ